MFVFRKPPVPALNKWTTLFPALSFWCLWELVFTEARLKKARADSGVEDHSNDLVELLLHTIRKKIVIMSKKMLATMPIKRLTPDIEKNPTTTIT